LKNAINKLVDRFGYRLIKNISHRNYHIVFTDKGLFLLKKIECGISEILFIHGVKEHLIKNGFDNIDRYITVKGVPYVRYGKDYYVMTKVVRGRKYNPNNSFEIQKASETLARLHEAGKNYNLNLGLETELRSNIGKLQEDYLERCEDLIYMKNLVKMKTIKNKMDFLFLKDIDILYDMAMGAVKSLQKNGYFKFCEEKIGEKYLCHNDYKHNNIIIDRYGEFNIINFDCCKFELRCFDIAGFIMDAMDKLNWNFERALEILKAYDSVRRIEEKEYELMASFLQFPQDIWEINIKYYYEDCRHFKYKYYIKLKKKIEKLPCRIDFLKKYNEKFL